MTNKECVEYIIGYLKEQKIKNIEIISDDNINFTHKKITYNIYIEDFENIHYGVCMIEGVDIGSDYWLNSDEYGDYEYIDEFFCGIVEEERYSHIKKIWNAFEKLEELYDADDVRNIAAKYFGMS